MENVRVYSWYSFDLMLKRRYREREKEKQRETERNREMRGKHRVTEEKEIERNGERVIES